MNSSSHRAFQKDSASIGVVSSAGMHLPVSADDSKNAIARYPITLVSASGVISSIDDNVQTEHTLDVSIDGDLAMRIVCTPENLKELVLGRLFTEGIIDCMADVSSIQLSEDLGHVLVNLHTKRIEYSRVHIENVPTTGASSQVYKTYFTKNDAPKPVTPIVWNHEWIFALARAFAQDSPMHRKTFGSHSCYLAVQDQVLYCCEDLGRHNAFDKVIGCALRDGIDLTQAIIFTSGRLPVDMVAKAVRAGVPLLVSKAVPTSATIEIARAFDLTLICSARPDSFKVYHNPSVFND